MPLAAQKSLVWQLKLGERENWIRKLATNAHLFKYSLYDSWYKYVLTNSIIFTKLRLGRKLENSQNNVSKSSTLRLFFLKTNTSSIDAWILIKFYQRAKNILITFIVKPSPWDETTKIIVRRNNILDIKSFQKAMKKYRSVIMLSPCVYL